MATYQLTPATAYAPISVAEAKTYLKIPSSVTDRDDLIEAFLAAAKEYVQNFTSRLLGENEVVQYWDSWPRDLMLKLKFGVIVSVDSIEVYDGTDWNAAADTDFSSDIISRPARVKMLSVSDYDLGTGLNIIRVTYTVGEDSTDSIPVPLMTVMYMLVAFWLENGTDQDITDLHYVHAILRQYMLNR